ncbi:LysR family transcriptional regulator [Hafnia alvei]|uniref:DNA-binding transcriptional regulator, LysR family n=1 Tax=Hafnia alvei TaxID=569 RepID=A0A1C6Z742_HAFAL|nr:LysR family transcriptional regulator [Hafnia alvei]SCM54936.1 DNA-binding transcriptional regulator, LysR family [Hafnia alvei]
MSNINEKQILKRVRSIDLNLLTVFEAIFSCKSVSLAAKTLNISPSAVSQSLQKIRNHYNDILFIRQGNVLQPTLVCLKVHEQLAEIMRLVDFSLNSRVDPLEKKKFIIYASQFMATFYLPKLINLLQHQSPNVEIVHHTLAENTNVDELLINRQADLVFDLHPTASHSVISAEFSTETLTLVCSTEHPRLQGKVDITQLYNERFCGLNSTIPYIMRRQVELSRLFKERNFIFSSDSVMTILSIIQSTESIGLVPTSLLTDNHYPHIRQIDIDIPFDPVTFYVLHNKHVADSPGFSQLLATIMQLQQSLHEK